MKKRLNNTFAVFLMVLLVLSISGCGGNAKDSVQSLDNGTFSQNNFGYDYAAPESQKLEDAEGGSASSGTAVQTQALKDAKLIYTAYLTLETKEFDDAASKLDALVESMGGYFQEQNINNYSGNYRSGYYIVRVPVEKYDEFLTKTGEICNIRSKNQSVDNISESYYDIESRLSTAKIKLERLQELLSKADTMADVITIESAISETEYTIDSLSGSLRSYDSLIDYSTITVELNEVYKYSSEDSAPLTFGQRILNALISGTESAVDSLANLVVWITYNWAALLIAAIVIVVIVRLRKKHSLSLPFFKSRKRKAASAVNAVTDEQPKQESTSEKQTD